MIKRYISNYYKLRKLTGRGRFDCMIGAYHLLGFQRAMKEFCDKIK